MVRPRRSGEGAPTPGARTAERGAPGNRIPRLNANFLELRLAEVQLLRMRLRQSSAPRPGPDGPGPACRIAHLLSIMRK